MKRMAALLAIAGLMAGAVPAVSPAAETAKSHKCFRGGTLPFHVPLFPFCK